jgi:hypothetical protein
MNVVNVDWTIARVWDREGKGVNAHFQRCALTCRGIDLDTDLDPVLLLSVFCSLPLSMHGTVCTSILSCPSICINAVSELISSVVRGWFALVAASVLRPSL